MFGIACFGGQRCNFFFANSFGQCQLICSIEGWFQCCSSVKNNRANVSIKNKQKRWESILDNKDTPPPREPETTRNNPQQPAPTRTNPQQPATNETTYLTFHRSNNPTPTRHIFHCIFLLDTFQVKNTTEYQRRYTQILKRAPILGPSLNHQFSHSIRNLKIYFGL